MSAAAGPPRDGEFPAGGRGDGGGPVMTVRQFSPVPGHDGRLDVYEDELRSVSSPPVLTGAHVWTVIDLLSDAVDHDDVRRWVGIGDDVPVARSMFEEFTRRACERGALPEEPCTDLWIDEEPHPGYGEPHHVGFTDPRLVVDGVRWLASHGYLLAGDAEYPGRLWPVWDRTLAQVELFEAGSMTSCGTHWSIGVAGPVVVHCEDGDLELDAWSFAADARADRDDETLVRDWLTGADLPPVVAAAGWQALGAGVDVLEMVETDLHPRGSPTCEITVRLHLSAGSAPSSHGRPSRPDPDDPDPRSPEIRS